jgi:hypothetical protein
VTRKIDAEILNHIDCVLVHTPSRMVRDGSGKERPQGGESSEKNHTGLAPGIIRPCRVATPTKDIHDAPICT